MPVRILFLSDTHLGVDLPARPRVERRRRGDDFFESFEAALAPVLSGETDLVIHGGDLFYRSKIPAWLADRVFTRLGELADRGVDIFWNPGNHERSGVPRGLLLTHPRVHVFDRPRTFTVERGGRTIALAGFPFSPRVRTDFRALVAATGHADVEADVKLLCIHQAVEGATVGPSDFVFRSGDDVVRGAEIPAGFAAVLSGHIHRYQVLTRDLAGRRLAAPVLYPGSTERTSFAEKSEPKGTLMLEADRGARPGGAVAWTFNPLPTRPMVDVELDPRVAPERLEASLRASLAALDPASVVRIRLAAEPPVDALPLLSAASLRALAPLTMNVTLAWRAARAAREDDGRAVAASEWSLEDM